MNVTPGNANEIRASQAPGGGLRFGYVQLSVAGGVDVTPLFATYQNGTIEITGVITANFNLVLPRDAGTPWRVKNSTTGNFQITVKGSGGTGVIVAQGKTVELWADGTNVYPALNDADAHGFRPNNQNVIAMSDANYNATFADMLADHIQVNGTLTGGRNFVLPSTNFKTFSFFNNTAQTVTPKTSGGSGIGVAAGKRQILQCDGTNVVALAAAI